MRSILLDYGDLIVQPVKALRLPTVAAAVQASTTTSRR